MYTDLRDTIRSLVQTPRLAAAIVLSLALGLGGNAAVAIVVDAVLVRPLPYPDHHELVAITYGARGASASGGQIPSPLFQALAEDSRTLEAIAAYNIGSMVWQTDDREHIRVSAAWMSPGLLSLLGVAPPAIGRMLDGRDDQGGAPPVALVSYAFWRSRLGGDQDVLLHRLMLRGRSYQVVGVVAERFRFPGYDTPEVLIPIGLPVSQSTARLVNVIGRVAMGSDRRQVQEEALLVDARLAGEYPASLQPVVAAGAEPRVLPLRRHVAGELDGTLTLMLCIAAGVLVLACINVASLLVAKYNGRAREVWTRIAIGATPGQLARRALVEAISLSMVGAGAALAAVWLSMDGMRTLLAGRVPHADALALDLRAVVILGTTASLAGVLCASLPVLALIKWHAQRTLTPGHFGLGGAVVGRRYCAYGVVGQIAVAVVLLVATLLLTRSFANLTNVDWGFDPEDAVTFRVPAVRGTSSQREAAIREMLQRMRTVPGVLWAGATTALPLEGHDFEFAVSVEGYAQPRPGAPLTAVDLASPGYFRAVGAKLEEGREFTGRDNAGSGAPVAIVNRAFADLHVRDGEPLGRRVSLGGGPDEANIVIVGVVGDIGNRSPSEGVAPHVYRPFAQAAPQMGWHTVTVCVRTAGGAATLVVPSLRALIAQTSGGVMYDVQTMEQRVATLVAPERVRAELTGLFVVVALILAGVGVLSLVSYTVAEQMREVHVRLALGCPRWRVQHWIMGRGMIPVCIGIVVGLAAAGGLAGVLRGFLYGVGPNDGPTFCAAALIVLCVAGVASYLPARRATEADLGQVLKNE